jgi:exopolyphosphatase/guanosine-5'-triphosphate,3'-diphosphate pyrophosphatase
MGTMASVEIGSNSIRMLIAEQGAAGTPLIPILRKRAITRLGEDFNKNRSATLKPGPTARSIATVKEFLEIANRFGVASPVAVATGVVREAANRDAFIASMAEQLGCEIEIISGQEEARLTEIGVLSSFRPGPQSAGIFDLGGGSTEFILKNEGKTTYVSVPLGVVTSMETYFASDPPKDREISRLSEHIQDICDRKLAALRELKSEGCVLLGTGGTVVTLGAIIHGVSGNNFSEETLHGLSVGKNAAKNLFENLKDLPATERLSTVGLEPGREDIILPGTLIIVKFMDYFGKDEIIVSYSDLLEGILIQHTEGARDG